MGFGAASDLCGEGGDALEIAAAAGGIVEELLGDGDCLWPGVEDLAGELIGAEVQFRVWDGIGDEAEIACLFRRDEFSREDEPASDAVADLADEILEDDGGDQPAQDFRESEVCGMRHEDEITGEREARAAAQGIALDHGDRGLGQAVEAGEHGGEDVHILDGEAFGIGFGEDFGSFHEVEAGAEGRALGLEDEDARIRGSGEVFEAVEEGFHEAARERIAAVRPVERQGGDWSLRVAEDEELGDDVAHGP
jgi:hypothetical protein